MTQDRLSSMSILNIENDNLYLTDLNEVKVYFALEKTTKNAVLSKNVFKNLKHRVFSLLYLRYYSDFGFLENKYRLPIMESKKTD